jgi:hypothetical protein
MAVEGDWEEMARKKLGRETKTSYVIWSDNESVHEIRCQAMSSEDWDP